MIEVLAQATDQVTQAAAEPGGITGSIQGALGCLGAAIGVGIVGMKGVEAVGRNPDAVRLVVATREPGAYVPELVERIESGASPRGTIALDRCARARAWLQGRDYVSPEDVHAVAPDVLRHRVLLAYTARAEGIESDDVVAELIRSVPLP